MHHKNRLIKMYEYATEFDAQVIGVAQVKAGQ